MNIVIREVDDWTAVYKDGVKVWENHSCPLVQGLEALGITFERATLDEDPTYGFNQDTLTINGGEDAFPERLQQPSTAAWNSTGHGSDGEDQ